MKSSWEWHAHQEDRIKEDRMIGKEMSDITETTFNCSFLDRSVSLISFRRQSKQTSVKTLAKTNDYLNLIKI